MEIEIRDVDISQYKSIDDLYKYIDDHAFHFTYLEDISDLWQKYSEQTNDDSEKEKALWEHQFFWISIQGYKVFPISYAPSNNDNSIKKYPDLNQVELNTINYLKLRASTSTNTILKARYNHLLWLTPNGIKKNDYAVAAIQSYLQTIRHLTNYIGVKERINLTITKMYEKLIAVSNQIKTDNTPLKDLTKFLLFECPGLKFYAKHGILEVMLEHPKIFKAVDLEVTISIYDNLVLDLQKEEVGDFLFITSYLPTVIKLAAKCKTDIKKWYNELGLAYLRAAEKETEAERLWLKQNNYAKAIRAFSDAGNITKKKEVEALYFELKPKVTLPTVSIPFDEKTLKAQRELHDFTKTLSKKILTQSHSEVYRTIASGFYFPKYQDVLKASKNDENSFLDHFSVVYFDRNQNIQDNAALNPANKKLYETYKIALQTSALPYLHYIILPGIKSGKLSYQNFISFLRHKSWIGKPHTQFDLGGEEITTNWINLLAPAIVEFFAQCQGWANSKYYYPNFVLCTDSLTLKMEGLFRNFCERRNIPTSVGNKKGMQETLIHNILESDPIKEYFNEDDRLLFNYIFSNEGMNLRNNVAHCFYMPEDYHLDRMLLLIAALLRLAKYDYEINEE